jgi:Mg2+/Co2+ transporter CorB
MTSADWFTLFIIFVFLLLSFFFTASETAVNACSRVSMRRLEHRGNRSAAIVNRLRAAHGRLTSALRLGRILVNIAATALATWMLIVWFGTAGVAYAIALMTAVIVAFCWMLPKTIAIRAPDRTALMVAQPTQAITRFLAFILLPIEAFAGQILARFETGADASQSTSSSDGSDADLASRAGGEKLDRDLVGNILDLSELEVSDVMIHRTKMQTLCVDDPPQEIIAAVMRAPITRWPLWSGSPENIVGVIHARDLLRALQAADGDVSQLDIRASMTPAWFVPDTTPLYKQLKAFRRRKTPFALVVDEYGEVMGLVTLEDIIEEIVGDVADERDMAVPGIRPQPDGSVSVDGGVAVRDLNRTMDWQLPDDEATTIAGLVIHDARSIPETGQSFTFHGFRFEILRRNRNRITALRVTPLGRAGAPKVVIGPLTSRL